MCKIGEFVPYKGYKGTIEFNGSIYCGSLLYVKDINYFGNDVMELFEKYKELIDIISTEENLY